MGIVFNLQPFSTNDGPGIRTVVFLKGCPLSCTWCHNPESRCRTAEIAYDPRSCLGCGACASVCPNECHAIQSGFHTFSPQHCVGCGRCADVCGGALECTGREMSVDEIVTRATQDEAFFRASGGGITLSGGEPLFQPDFSRAILQSCKARGISTCMETSCFAPWPVLESFLSYTDIFYCDWKLTDDALHRQYTGVSNALILENILRLDEAGAQLCLRCPIIPGINDTPRHFHGIADLANRLHRLTHIELMPYHDTWLGKNALYGYSQPMHIAPPSPATVHSWIDSIQREAKAEVIQG